MTWKDAHDQRYLVNKKRLPTVYACDRIFGFNCVCIEMSANIHFEMFSSSLSRGFYRYLTSWHVLVNSFLFIRTRSRALKMKKVAFYLSKII